MPTSNQRFTENYQPARALARGGTKVRSGKVSEKVRESPILSETHLGPEPRRSIRQETTALTWEEAWGAGREKLRENRKESSAFPIATIPRRALTKRFNRSE